MRYAREQNPRMLLVTSCKHVHRTPWEGEPHRSLAGGLHGGRVNAQACGNSAVLT